MLLVATLAFTVAALVVAGASVRAMRRYRAELNTARARLAVLGGPLPDDDDRRAVGASALRRSERVKYEADEVEHYRELLAHLLADFRDVAGAEEAVFWRFNAEGDALEPADWSTESPAPAFFDVAEWGPLIQ